MGMRWPSTDKMSDMELSLIVMDESEYSESYRKAAQRELKERFGIMAVRNFNLGENVKASVTGDTLTITIDLAHRGGVSASGKTLRVASSEGNQTVPGTDVKLGLNAYVPNR